PPCALLTSFVLHDPADPPALPSFPTRRSSDLVSSPSRSGREKEACLSVGLARSGPRKKPDTTPPTLRSLLPARRSWPAVCFQIRSEEHTSELQSRSDLVCRLLLEKKQKPKK